MKIFKKWWLWLIIIFLLSGFFLKTGLSIATEMELNCTKYNVHVCRCGGLVYDFGKECLGIRYSCEIYLDGCGESPRPLSNKEINAKLKSGELECGSNVTCSALGYTCELPNVPTCLEKGGLWPAGIEHKYSSCGCFDPNKEY